MSVVSEAYRILSKERPCVDVYRWTLTQREFGPAYLGLTAPQRAWLLIELGFDFDELVSLLHLLPDWIAAEAALYGETPMTAHNMVALYIQYTKLPDAVDDCIRQHYLLAAVEERLVARMLEAYSPAEPSEPTLA